RFHPISSRLLAEIFVQFRAIQALWHATCIPEFLSLSIANPLWITRKCWQPQDRHLQTGEVGLKASKASPD
ncbi:MAG: hypothetical protein JW829_20695, partial [Pirellulales bacterium]|nr:hypothetical protein [Pirellulales bacterium]